MPNRTALKAIVRAVWARWRTFTGEGPAENLERLAEQMRIDRLTTRRDWGPAPDPWPVTDDPYAKPEPCDVVPDPGKLAIDRLAERGLTAPLVSDSGVAQLLNLIDRQQDAEDHLRKIGMIWERGRGWYLP